MKLNHRFRKLGETAIGLAVLILSAFPALAAITPIGPYQAEALADPSPAVFTFQSSIAYYNNFLIYAGSDGKIYAYGIDTGTSILVSDTSALSTAFSAVQGFVVSSGNYLYFHDNAVTSNIYRLKLTDPWPAAHETLDSGITSAIFAFAENSWTDTIWFSSADFFGSGNKFYLYEIDTAFATATLRTSFVQPNSGGNGPILFKGPSTILYGESVFGGNGFFHLLNSSTGELIHENYLIFTAGIGDSTYGYNNRLYVTSGGGKVIYEIRGNDTPLALGTTDDEARGITFGDVAFFISEMMPFTGGADDGKISLNKGWDPNPVVEISPIDPLRAKAVADPDPEAFVYQSSVAYFNNHLIYAGNDGKIYGQNLDTSESEVISDTGSLATAFSSVQGFSVSSDNYLYFHDNAVTSKIYRILLTDAWPAQFESLDTQVSSAIFAFAENPWTNTIWFSSSDFFGSGNNFYLYEVNSEFTGVTLNLSFEQPNGGGNGPIIFENETTMLYGEAVFGGNGFFHQANTDTGSVIQENYLTISSGLGDAIYGYNHRIYVTSGGGKAIFEIDGNQKTQLATTHDEARGITFDGTSFFISAIVLFSGSTDDGEVSLLQLWQTRLSGVPTEQRVDDSKDLNADGIPDNQQPDVILSVNAADGSGAKQIGISPVGADVVVESLEAVDASTIAETANRPPDFPFGLINYRLKVTSSDGTAQVMVRLSEPAPADAKWYKYDPVDGWLDFSAYAAFSADRKTVTLELKDGEYGDSDRIVNGEISDPGGVAVLLADKSLTAFVTRFYQTCLGRNPDPAGLEAWVNALLDGSLTGSDVAYGFVFSQEFVNKNTTDQEYLQVLYEAFFNRKPDLAGLQGWLEVMQNGASREDILNGFIYAQEFAELCDGYGIKAYDGHITRAQREAVEAFVTRFYQLCLGRDPDAAGLEGWANDLLNQVRAGADVAKGFIYSQEFLSKNTSNSEYLQILYEAFFDRDPDPAGWDVWLAELNAGKDRGEVLDGFIYSTEFTNLCSEYGIKAF